ncbi:thioesterase family protein [Aureibaculum sp. A20]|uniref:Thioesterase family protein n=1 Tax=Aureibaculum flavum TaxID=2795986 RepID=A0ABS0WSB5_9FLAO|nr:acyl-CoA thioesterase [Aureibaculum flavum]MBJ2174871.1 thioesterase family protein [Aureibaculum flavum]
MIFKYTFKTRWSDFDPNRHLRHTAYNDYAAESRVRYLNEHNFGMDRFQKENIGPILFKEETTFYREVNLGEDITIELFLEGLSENGERFKFLHKIYREDGVLAAEIIVLGAWLDLTKRKLIQPPADMVKTFKELTKSENFEEIPLKSKS